MLQALQVTVEETARQLMEESLMGPKKRNESAETGCPILRALRLFWTCDIPQTIQTLKYKLLPSWGCRKPRHMQLWRHEQLRERSRPVAAESLKLFEVAKGCVLVGRLVTDPDAQVGITTLLEDSAGQLTQLGLYNQLPGGAVGSDALMLADKMFPKGATLRIAEPFMKVFRDGNRGVRVDSPHDLRVEPRVSSGKESREAGRQRGNALFGAGQFQAALTAYWQALRCCEDVAVLFSNRAQAYLKQEHWLEALRDSSAGLLLQPRNAKQWQRYAGALEGAGWPRLSVASAAVSASGLEGADLPDVAEVRQVLRKALSLTAHRPDGTGYRAKCYSKAVALYTDALDAHPDASEVAKLLSNLALCSIRTGMLHDAVATAGSCLRLTDSAKARRHLGQALALLGELELAGLTGEALALLPAGVLLLLGVYFSTYLHPWLSNQDNGFSSLRHVACPDGSSSRKRLELSSECVKGVVEVNAHGDKKTLKSGVPRDSHTEAGDLLLGSTTALYPGISMINHSSDPNCVLLPIYRQRELLGLAVAAFRSIKQGGELTEAYIDDAAVQRKWGTRGKEIAVGKRQHEQRDRLAEKERW
ncbi:unnamed protein product [Effrenium voratum]|nr:unnamed protein product [Effrenium voratum]